MNLEHANTNCRKDTLLDHIVAQLDVSKKALSSESTRAAIRFLVDVHPKSVGRNHREAIMERLFSQLFAQSADLAYLSNVDWETILGLMIKMMSSSTFYKARIFLASCNFFWLTRSIGNELWPVGNSGPIDVQEAPV